MQSNFCTPRLFLPMLAPASSTFGLWHGTVVERRSEVTTIWRYTNVYIIIIII